MKKLTTIFIVLLFACVLDDSVLAQSTTQEPTLSQTTDWIVDTIKTKGAWRDNVDLSSGERHEREITIKRLSIEKCVMTLESNFTFKAAYGTGPSLWWSFSQNDVYEIDLASLDPNSLSSGFDIGGRSEDLKADPPTYGHYIAFGTTGNRNKIKHSQSVLVKTEHWKREYIPNSRSFNRDENAFQLLFEKEEIARRSGKAMVYVIQLCGGKKDLF